MAENEIVETPGASASVVENPHTDDAERAYAKVDARQADVDALADEVDRMESKLARAKLEVGHAQELVAVAKQSAKDRAADLKAALDERDAVAAKLPDLAEAAAARRRLAHDRALLEARATLARLEGKGASS